MTAASRVAEDQHQFRSDIWAATSWRGYAPRRRHICILHRDHQYRDHQYLTETINIITHHIITTECFLLTGTSWVRNPEVLPPPSLWTPPRMWGPLQRLSRSLYYLHQAELSTTHSLLPVSPHFYSAHHSTETMTNPLMCLLIKIYDAGWG